MSWIVYALITPIFYSISVYIDKFIIDKKIKDPVVLTIVTGLFVSLFGIGGLVLLGFPKIEFVELIIILLAGIFLQLYLVPYFKALKLDETSRVVPLFQFVPIITLVVAYMFLNEAISLKQLLGCLLIVGGGFAISVNKADGSIFKPRPAFWYMLTSSALYALVGIFFRFVVKTKDFWVTLSYEYVGVGIGSILLLLLTSQRKQFLSHMKQYVPILSLITINNIIAVAAQTSESYAISLVPVALVSIVSGTQPLFTLVIGLVLSLWLPHLIKEDISRSTLTHKLTAIVIMIVGLYFVYS